MMRAVMPYGRRAGLVPRRQEDFGDGGAFPEVHVAQYPLSMGLRAGSDDDVLAIDARGRVAFDAVVRQGENSAKIVYTSHGDLVPKIAAAPEDSAEDDDDDEEVIQETTARTLAALRAIVDARLSAVQPATVPSRSSADVPRFVKYRPARQSAAFNSGAGDRVVRVEQAQEDPVLPPKHKRKRVPRPTGTSPPVTVLHSPPRPASRKDQTDWKIPPSVSDWKNAKGYTIPLDKRVASDGRRVRDVHVSDGFASLAEALCVAEHKAREAVQMRSMVATELRMKEAGKREQALREIAKKARAEMASGAAVPAPPADVDAVMQRDMVREERRHQREREKRREASSSKKSMATRDRDRNVSERVALGMASGVGAGGGGGEVAYDERLFNQDRGMDSGFAADDQYNVYSGRLFAAQMPTLYCPKKQGDSEIYGGDSDEQLKKITETGRFKPDRGFSGDPERAAGKRERPIEFDAFGESGQAYDPFVELDQYITRMKEGKKY